jgi:hypothetical protein
VIIVASGPTFDIQRSLNLRIEHVPYQLNAGHDEASNQETLSDIADVLISES